MKKNSMTPKIGGAVYLLPNLLTTGNLFFGYLSIMKSISGDFVMAAAAILLATVFDLLDGRVARLTNGSSEFGVQYDSLCDLVSFGLAPAIMVYHYSLSGLGKIAWVFCFIYVVCGALRLARFNVQTSIGKHIDSFIGLPIPIPAGVLSCFVAFVEGLKTYERDELFWLAEFAEKWHFYTVGVNIFFLCFLPLLAFLMVSNVAYRSHKSLNIKGMKNFRLLAILAVLIGLLGYKPALIGFLLFFIYSLSGIFEYLMGWQPAFSDDEIFQPHDHD